MDEEKQVEKPAVEWHEMRGKYIRIRGDEILAIIDPMEDFPCKAFGLQTLNGVYTTVEAAKRDGDKAIARFLKQVESHDKPTPNFYLHALKAVVATLEASAKSESE